MEHVGKLSHDFVDLGNVVGSAVVLCINLAFLWLFGIVLVDMIMLCAEPADIFVAVVSKGLTHGALYFTAVAEAFPVVVVALGITIAFSIVFTVVAAVVAVAVVPVPIVVFTG